MKSDKELSKLKDELAHKSEAFHLPYNPEYSNEYSAFKRGWDARDKITKEETEKDQIYRNATNEKLKEANKWVDRGQKLIRDQEREMFELNSTIMSLVDALENALIYADYCDEFDDTSKNTESLNKARKIFNEYRNKTLPF